MTREELIAYDRWLTENKWGSSEIITPEQAADLYLTEHPLPPAEGAEANRASIDDLIKKHIPIDAANFEYCAKHNIINGGLLQGIRDVVNSFMKPQPTAEGAEEILKVAWFGVLDKRLDLPKIYDHVFKVTIAAMREFATLHAQQMAEKMVEERLRAMTERCKKLEFMIESC